MQRALAAVVGGVGFLLLMAVAAFWAVPMIEDDLTERANSELDQAEVSGVEVSFTGRDGKLRGAFADEGEEALGSLRGARTVRVDKRPDVAGLNTTASTVAPADTTTVPADLDRPEVSMIQDGRTVVFTGVVGSEADRAALVNEARSAGYEVDDRLTIDSSLRRPEDVAAVKGLIRPLLAGSEDGDLELVDGVLDVTATANDPVEAKAIEVAAIEVEAAGLAVNRQLETLELSEDEQVVALQSSIDQIFELARAIEIESPNFGTTRRDLNESAVNILDRVAIELRRYPLPAVNVIGHADSRGSTETNQVLSEERAAVVVGYLVSGGVGGDRLEASGRGETEPVASNATDIGRLENRRVNFVVRKAVD